MVGATKQLSRTATGLRYLAFLVIGQTIMFVIRYFAYQTSPPFCTIFKEQLTGQVEAS